MSKLSNVAAVTGNSARGIKNVFLQAPTNILGHSGVTTINREKTPNWLVTAGQHGIEISGPEGQAMVPYPNCKVIVYE